MAALSFALLKAEQCGQCGPTWFVVMEDRSKNESFWPHMRELFGVPLYLDAKDAQCAPNIGCSKVQDTLANEANYPPWDVTRGVFARRLFPRFRLKERLEARRAELAEQDTLVAHLRGGDILPRRDLDYLPAPCGFVNHAARTGNGGRSFARVVLISDTPDHPCIAYMQERHPNVTFAPHSEVEDILTLMAAKSVALSTSSTFGFFGMLMNPNRDLNVFLPTYTGKHLCCEGNYDPKRQSELCRIGKGSAVYEFQTPRLGYVSSRKDWILDDASFANSTIHPCE